jgi:hypothetical protein
MSHRVRQRLTSFQLPPGLAASERPPVPLVYAAVAQDEARNDLIFDDVLKALESKRSPVVRMERRDHLEYFKIASLVSCATSPSSGGGMSAAERRDHENALRVSDKHGRPKPATGRYIGEGIRCRNDNEATPDPLPLWLCEWTF